VAGQGAKEVNLIQKKKLRHCVCLGLALRTRPRPFGSTRDQDGVDPLRRRTVCRLLARRTTATDNRHTSEAEMPTNIHMRSSSDAPALPPAASTASVSVQSHRTEQTQTLDSGWPGGVNLQADEEL